MSSVKDIDVVIRTCGERTTQLLMLDVKRLLPDSRLFIVEARPHFNMVLETFACAKNSTAQFTLALDADLILNDRAPEILSAGIDWYDLDNDARLHFIVKDKFVGTRDAANHLYNNNHAQKLFDFFDKHAEPNTDRPESDNLEKFSDKYKLKTHKTYLGKHNSEKVIPEYLGYHGYEQTYVHIYKSMFNCGVKYMDKSEDLKNGLESLVNKFPQDFDYKIALEGFMAGVKSGEIILDCEKYEDISVLLNNLSITEKIPIKHR